MRVFNITVRDENNAVLISDTQISSDSTESTTSITERLKCILEHYGAHTHTVGVSSNSSCVTADEFDENLERALLESGFAEDDGFIQDGD